MVSCALKEYIDEKFEDEGIRKPADEVVTDIVGIAEVSNANGGGVNK